MDTLVRTPSQDRSTARHWGLTVFMVLVTACSSQPKPETTDRDASAYAAVIDALLQGSPLDQEDPDRLPVIYVEAFAQEGISLTVQVQLVTAYADTYQLRFVDDRGEALLVDLEKQPVRSSSALIGLGPILGENELSIRGERYVDQDTIEAYRFSLADGGNQTWILTPTPIDPEGFARAP
ncbi:MAG: hypothetical protein HKN03_11715 [Acidimicrobiales bacterium]|nr:hypothetical protein [Acidimicrobiales bacterium]